MIGLYHISKTVKNSTFKITISSVTEYEGISYKIDDFLIYAYEFDTDILGSAL